jgi:hypothetical protein
VESSPLVVAHVAKDLSREVRAFFRQEGHLHSEDRDHSLTEPHGETSYPECRRHLLRSQAHDRRSLIRILTFYFPLESVAFFHQPILMVLRHLISPVRIDAKLERRVHARHHTVLVHAVPVAHFGWGPVCKIVNGRSLSKSEIEGRSLRWSLSHDAFGILTEPFEDRICLVVNGVDPVRAADEERLLVDGCIQEVFGLHNEATFEKCRVPRDLVDQSTCRFAQLGRDEDIILWHRRGTRNILNLFLRRGFALHRRHCSKCRTNLLARVGVRRSVRIFLTLDFDFVLISRSPNISNMRRKPFHEKIFQRLRICS